MKRRRFISGSAIFAGAVPAMSGCGRDTVIPQPDAAGRPSVVNPDGTLAGLPLETIRDQFRDYLFNDFLPFHYEHVIDHEYGGFMCNTDRDGTNITTKKTAWYEGRGSWTYSYLYNNIDKDPKHLETARKSIEFILPHQPSGDTLWPRSFSRDGKTDGKPEAHVYGDCFVAAGLAEYAKAVGDDKYWTLAKDILLKCVRIYDRDDYCPNPAGKSLGPDIPSMAGARQLSEWMVFLWVVMPLLDYKSDSDVEEIASRCIDAVLNHHHNQEFDLVNEYLNHDMSHTENDYDQYVPPATSMETYWMIINEAVRRKDAGIFNTVGERFRRHVEFGWDDVYGGIQANCFHVDNNVWDINRKVMWAQVEAFNGLQLIVEHSGAQWAKDWYAKSKNNIFDKWLCRNYGHSLIIDATDRKMSFPPHTNRSELYHYPRFLMTGLLSTERMIERGGKVSGVFV